MNNNPYDSTRQVNLAEIDLLVAQTKLILSEQLLVWGHDFQIQKFRQASWLGVRAYQSPRLGGEICFGLLPETCD